MRSQQLQGRFAIEQAAEDGVVGPETHLLAVDDEELAAVPVRTGAGNGQGVPDVGPPDLLVLDVVPGPTGAVAPGQPPWA